MNQHADWKRSYLSNQPISDVVCICGEVLHPDPPFLFTSIKIAHFRHIIEVIQIPHQDSIIIET